MGFKEDISKDENGQTFFGGQSFITTQKPLASTDNLINYGNGNAQTNEPLHPQLKEDKETEYEILSFRNKVNGNILKQSFISKSPELYEINSVLRKKDNCIFSIGDIVTYAPRQKYSFNIDNFFLTDKGNLLVRSKDNEMVEVFNDDLLKITKSTNDNEQPKKEQLPTPLFTTEQFNLLCKTFELKK